MIPRGFFFQQNLLMEKMIVTKHYQDYLWREGIPYGLNALEDSNIQNQQITFKIISDPYKKRISIEKYIDLQFNELIYDSYLLDFRSLKSSDQTAWQKTLIKETPDSTVCLIRNQDDRMIFFEECFFEKDFCRTCQIRSPQGIPLSLHKMYYQVLNDSFNGVTLFDNLGHLVMFKQYATDEISGEFTDVIKENWDTKGNPIPLLSIT